MNKDTLICNDSEQPSVAADTNTDELNIKITRRHLLKGAAFGAPVILTLRSGALMAAGSCTGVLNISATAPAAENAGNHCIQAAEICTGSGNHVRGPITDGTLSEEQTFIDYDVNGTPIYSGSGRFYCDTDHPILVSSAAYTSLNSYTIK